MWERVSEREGERGESGGVGEVETDEGRGRETGWHTKWRKMEYVWREGEREDKDDGVEGEAVRHMKWRKMGDEGGGTREIDYDTRNGGRWLKSWLSEDVKKKTVTGGL